MRFPERVALRDGNEARRPECAGRHLPGRTRTCRHKQGPVAAIHRERVPNRPTRDDIISRRRKSWPRAHVDVRTGGGSSFFDVWGERDHERYVDVSLDRTSVSDGQRAVHLGSGVFAHGTNVSPSASFPYTAFRCAR